MTGPITLLQKQYFDRFMDVVETLSMSGVLAIARMVSAVLPGCIVHETDPGFSIIPLAGSIEGI